jgi:hypothetical protein
VSFVLSCRSLGSCPPDSFHRATFSGVSTKSDSLSLSAATFLSWKAGRHRFQGCWIHTFCRS